MMLYTGFVFAQCIIIPTAYLGFLLAKNSTSVKRIVAWSTLSGVPLSVILIAAMAQSIPPQGVPPQDVANVNSWTGLIASYTLVTSFQIIFFSIVYIVFFLMIKSPLIRRIIAGLTLASLPITAGIATTLTSTTDHQSQHSAGDTLIALEFS